MTTAKFTVFAAAALAIGTSLYAMPGRATSAAPAATATPATSAAIGRAADAVVASVDGHDITVADVDGELSRALGVPIESVPAEQRELMCREIEAEVIETLIAKHLIQAEFEASTVEVSEADIDAAVAEIEAALPASTSLAAELEKSDAGMDEFRASIAKDLAARGVLDGVFAAVVEPGDDEIRAFYDEHTELFELGEAGELAAFDEVRGDIAMYLGESQRAEAMATWVESLKAKAVIAYAGGEADAACEPVQSGECAESAVTKDCAEAAATDCCTSKS